MTTRISSSSLGAPLPVDNAVPPLAHKEDTTSIANPTKSRFREGDSNLFGALVNSSQEPWSHVTDVTSDSPEVASNRDQKGLSEALEQHVKILAPFLLANNDNSSSQIFIFNEKRDLIELHKNTLEADLTIEASHEAVKKYFVEELTELYGETASNVLYPEKERSQPLTPGKAQDLIKSFAELQNSVLAACDGDFSKYDSCLAAQLKTLAELKTAIANPPPVTPVESTAIDYLSKQTGISPHMISAGFIAGGVLAASAATSGLAFPVAFHAAMTTALAHSPLLGAAAGMTGASHMSAAVSGATSMSAGGTASTGMWIGIGTGLLSTTYGATALTALSHINAQTGIAAGTGAFVGAIGGGVATAGTTENPASTGTIIAGMVTGATVGSLLGGLSGTFSASTVGTTIGAGTGSLGALIGTVTGGRSGGTSGALLGAARGAATGVVAGGVVTLFGGLCSAVAISATTATGTATAITTAGGYGEIAAGTAIAGYMAASTEINNIIGSAIESVRAPISNNHAPSQVSVLTGIQGEV